MPDRPLLILPAPAVVVQRRLHGFPPGRVHRPERQRQGERLESKFDRLRRALEERRVEVQVAAEGTTPEEVLVLEVVGGVEEFVSAVRQVGLEWLGELDVDDLAPDDDFHDVANREKRLTARLYLVFTDQRALAEMLRLWTLYSHGQRLDRGLRRWEVVFENLHDIRPWGVMDRLMETGVIEDWRERLGANQERFPTEIELWFRSDAARRTEAAARVGQLVSDAGGRVLASSVVEEIAYHGLIADLPAETVARIVQQPDIDLVRCEQVQFFRATGQSAVPVVLGEEGVDAAPIDDVPTSPTPIAALLDGLPLQRHRRLEGRLIIDDPDGFEEGYLAADRSHGTAMASLIVQGDLNGNEKPLPHPLYVRPVMRPNPRDFRDRREEGVPDHVPIVDLFHRAIRRMKEGEGGEAAVAPSVHFVNVSIGISDRPFDRMMSPLARLLDWLAWKYRLLIMVSAGNQLSAIEVPLERAAFRALEPLARQQVILRAVAGATRLRRLLAPSESVNALSVASVHADQAGAAAFHPGFDAMVDPALPSLFNGHGLGFQRAVKPDVLFPGGRAVLEESLRGSPPGTTSLDFLRRRVAPGQEVACPGPNEGDVDKTCHSVGTSNSTALATRAAVRLFDVVNDLRESPGGRLIDRVPMAVWIKALLVHGARWGAAGDALDAALRTEGNGRKLREYLCRFLGYGSVDVDRVAECSNQRVTVLSGGELEDGAAQVHKIPLPPALSAVAGWRRLTITLAWLTPVNPRHRKWRCAQLWFEPPTRPVGLNRTQADWRAVRRGTVQHEILEGRDADPFIDGDSIDVQVNCREDATGLRVSVPYALVASLEVAEGLGIAIYDEIRERVQARVQVRPA